MGRQLWKRCWKQFLKAMRKRRYSVIVGVRCDHKLADGRKVQDLALKPKSCPALRLRSGRDSFWGFDFFHAR